MLFCLRMRRSTIWFIIAALWMIDTILTWSAGTLRRALPAAGVAALFLVVGLVHRRREGAALRRPRAVAR